jgi:hypothetical protein
VGRDSVEPPSRVAGRIAEGECQGEKIDVRGDIVSWREWLRVCPNNGMEEEDWSPPIFGPLFELRKAAFAGSLRAVIPLVL